MAKGMLPRILLAYISLCTACQVVHSQPKELYVKAKDSSLCPNGIPASLCNTLDWYSHNVNISFTSGTKIIFLEGIHSLDTFIDIIDCHNFTITGNGDISQDNDGLPQPNAWINCVKESNNGLRFRNSTDISIEKIGLNSCSGEIMHMYKKQYKLNTALAFDLVSDINLHKIVINDTIGFGLHCKDVYGKIHVTRSAFMNAKGTKHLISGNAQLWFDAPCHTSNVVIESSWFLYGNKNVLKNYAASGLQILIFCPSISIHLNQITVYDNKGVDGGNLALSLTEYSSNYNFSFISISNSNISKGHASRGGGLRFWSQIKSSNNITWQSLKINNIILKISNCTFNNNVATITGGAVYISHHEIRNNFSMYGHRQISITNSTFIDNKGADGAAMEILRRTITTHITQKFSVTFRSCRFCNNHSEKKLSSAIQLIRIESTTLINCNFTSNSGSVFSLRNSDLNFLGAIRFEGNKGAHGGALKVCDSSLVFLHKWTNVAFISNKAQKGGAIYAQQGCLDTAPACFFQPLISESMPVENLTKLMTLNFVNNSATIAGDAIYGGSLDFCYTSAAFIYKGEKFRISKSYQIFKSIFNMTEQSGSSNISSNPRGVCFCDIQKGEQCRVVDANLLKYPGQTFNLSLTAVGQLNGSTNGLIDAKVVGHYDNKLASFNSLSAKFNVQQHCINLTYVAYSNQTNMTVSFTVISYDVNTYYDSINASLFLSLLQCPFGFKLTETPPYTCTCDPLLQNHSDNIVCDIDKQIIYIKDQLWFGCDSNAEKLSKCNLAVNSHCLHFCRSHIRSVNIRDLASIDNQCLLNRTGILCGACKPGYSHILGSLTECRVCSSKNLFFLLPLFLSSGIIIIILLTALNLTVTEGMLNGLITYTNIIYTRRDLFSGSSSLHFTYGKFCEVFIAWLNFDIGIELCFYEGMDAYQKLWLLYGFAFYLLALQITIIMLCRRFTSFTRLCGKNVVKVLATLIYLMYSPLIYAIIQTLQETELSISTPNGIRKKSVCFFDGNIPYLGPKHIPLFIAAVICFTVISWFTFSLLLIQCLQRRANLFCFWWVERLRPFFEAYTGPCHNNYRFWPGFLLFMRCGLYTLNSANTGFTHAIVQSKLIPLGTAAACVTIMSLSCIFPSGVYKKWPANVLEFSFFLNLCITSALWIIFRDHNHRIIYTSVSVTMATFIGIIMYHLRMKIKSSTCTKCVKLKKQLSAKLHCCHSKNETNSDDEDANLLSQALPPLTR